MKTIKYYLCILLVAFSCSSFAQKEEQVDLLGLAALLVSDGNLSRAESVLDSVNVQDKKTDLAQYYLLRGLLNFKSSQYPAAKANYMLSIEHGQQDKLIYIYLAQSLFAQQDYEGTLEAIADSAETGVALASVYSLKAQCYWEMKQYSSAWAALADGQKRFPQETRYMRQQVYYYIDLGLYQEALSAGQKYLATGEGSDKEYVVLGRALRESNQLDLSIELLEKAKLRFPKSVAVMTELAHSYLKQEKALAASDLFAQAYVLEPKLAGDTAELYRQAGRLYRALNINAEVSDQPAKLKQRLAILVELENFDLVAGMGDALYRNGLLENQDILYAHAYALYRTGDFKTSQQQLAKLTRPDLFRKATELRKAMDKCADAKWRCL